MKDFEFHVGGIEDAILNLLEAEMKPLGVKNFAYYSGELDSENLKRALGELTPNFPLVMVSYTDGKDVQDARTAPVLNKPLYFRHECSFSVICLSNDARGENARRRGKAVGTRKLGVYQMVSIAREVLGGLRIKVQAEDEKILLNDGPFMPSGVEYIARIPNVTAYAAMFDTYFRYSTPDRGAAGTAISEIILGLDSLNEPLPPTDNLPGIEFIIGEN